MLKNEILLGLGAAVVTGSLVAIQATFLSRSGAAVGTFRSSLATAVVGAAVAGAFLLVLWRQNATGWNWDRATWLTLLLAGILGIAAMVGITFASQRVGVTAALASVLLGQMLVSMIVDARGLGTTEAIPVTWPRVLGVLLLFGAVALLNFRR